MYTIGYDIGSSSVKAALVEAETGRVLARVTAPDTEMSMDAPEAGWAEQNPEDWYKYVVAATKDILARTQVQNEDIKAVGIGYQMHGLVMVDAENEVVRPSIIWCDGRAVGTGEEAFKGIGAETCLEHCLNSPGNFTAAKLKWVADNEPDNYKAARYAMLPGDYIALRLTGEATTTITGLSEGVFWDFKENQLAGLVMEEMGLDESKIPPRVPAVGGQGKLTEAAARELGLMPGTVVGYRAGDQPNNALSLNVLAPGEVAATGGTSGVVYGVTDRLAFDPQQRVNSFAHVNHEGGAPRIGVLLCINGSGILHRWVKNLIGGEALSYGEMETMAGNVPVGSDGLHFLPFGNGPERMLGNKNVGAHLLGLDLNRHGKAHIVRAGLEGIAFAFVYGMKVMKELGVDLSTIRVGNDNLFQSKVFSETIATLTGATIEVHNTTGAVGAALASAVSVGLAKNIGEAVGRQEVLSSVKPGDNKARLQEAYAIWEAGLRKMM
ncbi:carbohydrate kinase [Neolewinella aurantiaca]|uniref:Carbohydrate kinase n=1 Tax=Neolewinella aurantiaca TaxID=2602767 RepID=A0A5C7FVY7_9BACT|nr:FGGY family carbohydrate kinase [Neolewinella aurantiaca]TXF90817.1 carbohydrate kinase [Neolewinella aurantiaca]